MLALRQRADASPASPTACAAAAPARRLSGGRALSRPAAADLQACRLAGENDARAGLGGRARARSSGRARPGSRVSRADAERVKTLNRTLYEAGVFVLRDSPTGKRYGRRDDDGRIVEAYGFDLSARSPSAMTNSSASPPRRASSASACRR